MNTFDLTLDLSKRGPFQSVPIRQGDKSGTTIRATITDHGVAVSTSGLTSRFVMRLPDNEHYYRETATLSGSTATVTIDEAQAASAAGRTDVAYFQLLQGTDVIASTESFTVIVLPDALADAEVAESYDSAIQDAIDNLSEAVEQLPSTVEDVLADHPEWTTTVQDGSITEAKLGTDLARDRERLLYRLANMLTAALPEGDVATASDAAKTPMAGLALYGRSTQDGTPTPSAPVPIVSVEPDSDGNISLLSKRTSDATQQSVTPIPLDGHELRSLPDGTRDELRVDERGHAVLVQRVGSAEITAFDGTGAVGGRPYGYKTINGKSTDTTGNRLLCDKLTTTSGSSYYIGNNPANVVVRGLSGQAQTDLGPAVLPLTVQYPLATPVTIDLGYVDAVPLVGPDLTAQAIPTAPFALTYERDLNTTLARLESAIATLA